MTSKKQSFSRNLSFCCATHRSVSQVCRDIGINRPQFVRYLKGEALPSAHNLSRIAAFFSVSEEDLFLTEAAFQATFAQNQKINARDPREVLMSAFRSEDRKLKNLEGLYHSYYISPAWGYGIVRSLVDVRLEQGVLMTRGIMRMPVQNRPRQMKHQYLGLMTAARGHLFVMEKAVGRDGALCETVFKAPPHYEKGDLRGKVISVTWNAAKSIFVSPAVWRPVEEGRSIREIMKECGVLSLDSRSLPNDIRVFLKSTRSS